MTGIPRKRRYPMRPLPRSVVIQVLLSSRFAAVVAERAANRWQEDHEGPNNPDPETQAGLNAIMAAQFTTPPNPCSTNPSPHHPSVQP